MWLGWLSETLLTDGDSVDLALDDNCSILATKDVHGLVDFAVLNGHSFVLLVFLLECFL
jgi:hypothetical protein